MLAIYYYDSNINIGKIFSCNEKTTITVVFLILFHFQFFLVDFMGCSVGLVKDKDSQSSHGRYDDWDVRFDSSQR